MAMKKAELEEHRSRYQALMSRARAAQREGLYREAVELALSSWDHVDGMMQYERRYEKREFASIESIDVVLRFSPALLDFPSLDKLEALLKDYRRIDKNTSESLVEKLAAARSLMWQAHGMWDHLEQHPDTRQDELRQILGGDQNQWRSLAEMWEKMGLVCRTPEGGSYRLALSTRMGKVVPGKCSSCGAVSEAPKAMFLEELACPDCHTKAMFVMLTQGEPTENKE